MNYKKNIYFQCRYSNAGLPFPFAVIAVVLMTPVLHVTMGIDFVVALVLVAGSIVLSYIAPGVSQSKTVTITGESVEVETHGPTTGDPICGWPVSDIQIDSLVLSTASILGFHAIGFRTRRGDKATISFPSRKLALEAITVIKRLNREPTQVQENSRH